MLYSYRKPRRDFSNSPWIYRPRLTRAMPEESSAGLPSVRQRENGRADFRRSMELFRAFRIEKSDPDRFYRLLAKDSVSQVVRHQPLVGKLVLDVGGGAGYFTNAFRDAGARCVLIEPELRELWADNNTGGRSVSPHGSPSDFSEAAWVGSVVGNGYRLPFADSTTEVCFSSNVLEHVSRPEEFITEMVRVTKPGGVIYVSFTNWYSPWGGHGTSPWHYFGGERALKRYKRVYGREPINRYGETLFATHVGPILHWVRSWSEVAVLEARPRYYPAWCNWVVHVPGLREVATWNLMLILRRA